ncbi:MAG: EAL domain-containing protein [Dehalococcoidia bacterium]|nr:EAL domain-containing protein [Dehalococcoidia bacterium]
MLPGSLRARILLLVVAGTLLSAAGLLVAQRLLLQSSYGRLEATDTSLHAEQVRSEFLYELESLDFTLRDWAVWDDTYHYVHSPNPEYERANLSYAALSAINLDLLAITDRNGRQLAIRSLDRASASPRPLAAFDSRPPGQNPLTAILELAYVAPEEAVLGIVQLESGPMLIGARAVLPIEDAGEPGGVMVMARMLDGAVVSELSHRSGVELHLVPAPLADMRGLTGDLPVRITAANAQRFDVDILLTDLTGVPVGTLSFELGRPIAESARETFELLAAALVVAMLCLGTGITVATDIAMVAPLRRVTAAVREIGRARDGNAAVPVPRGEIGELAKSLNGMLAELADAARERERKDQRFQAMVAHSSDAICIVSELGRVLFATPSASGVWGRPQSELYSNPLQTFVAPEDARALGQLLLHGPRGATVQRLEVRVPGADGAARTIEVVVGERADWEAASGWVVDARDVTDRVRFSAELQRQATHDDLTGLANRAALIARLQERLDEHRGHVAVLFLDLDNFKMINDTLGHRSGDLLLRAVAERLRALVRPGDVVARLGGDEFVILLDAANSELARNAAQTVLRALAVPIAFEGQQVAVSLSIGVAAAAQESRDAQVLLGNADIALYRAKAAGRGSIVVFDPSLDAAADEQRQLQLQVPGATARGEMRVHYQPIVDLATSATVGIEALARWHNPKLGVIQPPQFLRASLESGEIIEIGRFVLRDACRKVQSLLRSRVAPGLPVVSVNISAREFVSERFYDDVVSVVREFDIPPACLQLEIAEDAVIGDVSGAAEKLARLRKFGLRLALDDFGTGYSSLTSLERLPISALKVNPALVQRIASDRRARGVFAALLQMANSLDIHVIAEGVETEEQARTLMALGTQAAQGHYFRAPAPFEELGLARRTDEAVA